MDTLEDKRKEAIEALVRLLAEVIVEEYLIENMKDDDETATITETI